MTEERVYLNSEHFKDSFNEESVAKIFEISKIKVEISKLAKKANNLIFDNKSLIVERQFKKSEFQKEYRNLTLNYSGEELKNKWLESKVKNNLQAKMTIIKTLLRNNQSELKNIKVKIQSLSREMSRLVV